MKIQPLEYELSVYICTIYDTLMVLFCDKVPFLTKDSRAFPYVRWAQINIGRLYYCRPINLATRGAFAKIIK